jgi:hypothetical protein
VIIVALSEEDESAASYADKMIADIEALEHEIPSSDFQKTRGDLAGIMKELEKAYHERERKINIIMTNGTGFETREALRMVPTPMLDKWAKELSTRKGK